MKRAPKEPWTSSGFHKTIFWWVKCKCIRNIWIKFPLKHVGVWKRGGKAGQTHFRVLANPKHLKSTLRCLNKSKPTALAHPGWDGSSTRSQADTQFPDWEGGCVCTGQETAQHYNPEPKQGLCKPWAGPMPHHLSWIFQCWLRHKEAVGCISGSLTTKHNSLYMILW